MCEEAMHEKSCSAKKKIKTAALRPKWLNQSNYTTKDANLTFSLRSNSTTPTKISKNKKYERLASPIVKESFKLAYDSQASSNFHIEDTLT